jgi:hypothetical protein
VDPLSCGGAGRLNRGHVIQRFNNRDVRTIRDLERAAAGIRSGDVVSLIVLDARATNPQPTIINYRAQ